MKRPTVFVGSSSEGLSVAEAVQVALDQECEVTLWTQGIFCLGLSNLENLSRVLGDYDFAVLVLTPDDVVFSRGQQNSAARDNVIFELGLFMGAIGRDRAFVLHERNIDLRIPSDLAGISTASYMQHTSGNIQSAIGSPCTQMKQAIRRLGCKHRFPPTVFQSVDTPSLFELGTEMVTTAQYRIALVAKTPIVITGPRPFGETMRFRWEVEQFDCFNQAIERASTNASLDFRCVGSISALRHEFNGEDGQALRESVALNLNRLQPATEKSQPRVLFTWCFDINPMTYLVVDDWFLIWFKDEGDKFCLRRQDVRIANALWSHARSNSSIMTNDALLRELGLKM
jgi:Predicted nucleotide-binding protein containing TIR-like domain